LIYCNTAQTGTALNSTKPSGTNPENDFDLGAELVSLPEFREPGDETEGGKDVLHFPASVISGLAGDFADIYSASLETPRHFLYAAFLTALGSLVADRITLNSEIRPQPRLFTILLGESADDRKSTAITKTIEFFQQSITEGIPTCWGISSAEGLQRKLSGSNKLLLCFDEFRQFVSKCRIEGSVLLPCTNSLFESNRYESHTKSQSIVLQDAYLSMLAASTTETYEKIFTPEFLAIGFANRLFLVPGGAERKFSLPVTIGDSEKMRLRHKLGKVLEFASGHPVLNLEPIAREIYHHWYMNLERGVHSKRLDTYSLRLMILLAVNDQKEIIDRETVAKAIRLANWQLNVRRLLDPIDAETNIARLEERIRRVLTIAPKSERDLRKAVHYERVGLWTYQNAVQNLTRSREIQWNKAQGKWELSPNLSP